MFVLVRSGHVLNTICVERKENMDECEDREEKKPNPVVVSSSTSLPLCYQGFLDPSFLKMKN